MVFFCQSSSYSSAGCFGSCGVIMPRYAIFYGYIGTYLRGVPKIGLGKDYESVEGLMEAALQRFPVSNTPQFKYSSRTDQGVHALRTCGHVDLVHEREGRELAPVMIHKGMNKFFRDMMRPIRVQEVRKVCDDFSARHCAVSRTYVYRFAVLHEKEVSNADRDHKSLLPMTEVDNCFLLMPPFDADKAREVPKLFLGEHDFASFGRGPRKKEQIMLESRGIAKSTVRRVYDCYLEPGVPFLVSPLQPRPAYDVWNFHVRASGFLYNMVRRMVGAVIAVGRGTIDISDVQQMLANPSQRGWNSHAATAPADGLFLVDVEYDPRSLEDGYKPDKHWSRSRFFTPAEPCDEDEGETSTPGVSHSVNLLREGKQ